MTRKNWLITGVSSGFGNIMTKKLLERGDSVAGTVRDVKVMEDLQHDRRTPSWIASSTRGCDSILKT